MPERVFSCIVSFPIKRVPLNLFKWPSERKVFKTRMAKRKDAWQAGQTATDGASVTDFAFVRCLGEFNSPYHQQ